MNVEHVPMAYRQLVELNINYIAVRIHEHHNINELYTERNNRDAACKVEHQRLNGSNSQLPYIQPFFKTYLIG